MSDYERIARIISFLDENFLEQPDLSSLASEAGLSQHHFHRLFTNWAGTTPKAFLRCPTLNHARERLRQGESVLDAALDSGLSGPGRLHDLCVQLEAASPGEVKSGGAGLMIEYGIADTPFGSWLVGKSERGISHVSFVDPDPGEKIMCELVRQNWPVAQMKRADSVAEELSQIVFSPGITEGKVSLRAFVSGTAFQLRVWRALLEIPPGSLISYGHLANLCESPKAARAVGTAVGDNPLAYLIPCHRVVRATGAISQYRWGAVRKKMIIGHESVAN